MTHTTTSKFNVDDIVTIARDYKEFANFDFAQPQINVYSVRAINAGNTVTLAGVWPDIPSKHMMKSAFLSVFVGSRWYTLSFLIKFVQKNRPRPQFGVPFVYLCRKI